MFHRKGACLYPSPAPPSLTRHSCIAPAPNPLPSPCTLAQPSFTPTRLQAVGREPQHVEHAIGARLRVRRRARLAAVDVGGCGGRVGQAGCGVRGGAVCGRAGRRERSRERCTAERLERGERPASRAMCSGWVTNQHPLGGIPSGLLFKLPGDRRRERGRLGPRGGGLGCCVRHARARACAPRALQPQPQPGPHPPRCAAAAP